MREAPGREPEPPARAQAIRRLAGFALGALLLGAAIWAVAGMGSTLVGALASALRTSPWLLAAAVLLPVLNWLATSLSFWVLMGRYGRVGPAEMSALIGAAWLLNYLPLRPGLVGRIAYHRAVHGIAVRHAAWVTVLGMLASAACVAWLLAGAALLGPGSQRSWPALLAGPLVALPALAALSRVRGSEAWRLWAMIGFRYLDLLLWIARYAVVFALVGVRLNMPAAIAVAAVSQAALAVPLVGNGLGLREWAVGLSAGMLPAGVIAASATTELGLAADLVNRAAELAAAIPVGLLCWGRVAGRLGSARPN